MEVNNPDVVAEVSAAFARYEQALVTNDVAALNELFWDDPRTVRYGATENLCGCGEIQAFRAARSRMNLAPTVFGSAVGVPRRSGSLARERGDGRLFGAARE